MKKIIKKTQWNIAQFIEIRWWQNYLRTKSVDDYLAWKKQYWINFLAATEVNITLETSVLDLGCGPAGIFMIFDQQKVTALDPLLVHYEQKLPHFKRSFYPNVTFLSQSLEDFAPQQQQSTAVFCINAINHVADLEKSFDILMESVAQDGHLIVSIDVHNYSFFKYLFRYCGFDALHPHQYDLEEYSTMLTERKGKIIKQICYKKEFFFDYYVLVVEKL